MTDAHIAQVVEHFLGKEEVIGSNPIVSTTKTELRQSIGMNGALNFQTLCARVGLSASFSGECG